MKTPDEQNDEIRAMVDKEFPRPVGGFESDSAEDEWKIKRENRFLEIVLGGAQ